MIKKGIERIKMVTYVYRPNDPNANEFGIVEKTDEMVAEAPNVIRDEMDSLRNMADGKMYSSKAKFRQATRDAGCVEIGNENPIVKPRPKLELDRRQRREDIRKAIRDLRDGRAPRIDQILSMPKE
jgi:hypothetical protein